MDCWKLKCGVKKLGQSRIESCIRGGQDSHTVVDPIEEGREDKEEDFTLQVLCSLIQLLPIDE